MPGVRPSSIRPCIAVLVTLVLVLGLVPALLDQPATSAAPAGQRALQPSPLQGEPGALVALRHQGNLWLMREDGSDLEQVTDYAEGVASFAWSPSGRYLLIGRGWGWSYASRLNGGQSAERPPRVVSLYDVTTGELRDLLDLDADAAAASAYGRMPSWAVDADELMMEVAEQGGNYSLVRVSLDGTTTPVVTYHNPPLCGGMDGPFTLYVDLYYMQELGWSPSQQELGQIIWWEAGDTAYINNECFRAIAVDLATAAVTEHASGRWAGALPDGRLMLAPMNGSANNTSGVFDPRNGSITQLPPAEQYVAGPGGEIFFTTVTEGSPSDFSFRFDDVPSRYVDREVQIWQTDDQGSEPRLVATLDAQRVGIPAVTADGSALIVAVIDNPTALMDVDTSGFDTYASDIFAEHQRVIRIEVASGEATVLATGAQRPRIQPAGATVTDTPDSGEADEGETPTAGSDAGLVAFTGEDGNIWVGAPDGQTVWPVTTDGSPERPYIDPNWSPDGAMLVFSTANPSEVWWNDIYLLRNGVVTRIPGIRNCKGAAFTPDSERLVLVCAAADRENLPTQETLDASPSSGFVSLVDLDGSNWDVLAPFPLLIEGQPSLWWTMLWTGDINVSPVDGEILVNTVFMSSSRMPGVHLINSAGEWDAVIGTPAGERGRIWGAFSADGEHLLIRHCRGCHRESTGPPANSVLLMDRDGAVVETLYTPAPDVLINSFTQSPDGGQLLLRVTTAETDFDLGTPGLPHTTQLVDLASGDVTPVPLDGGGFAWQPAAVAIALPGRTDGLQPTTPFVNSSAVAAICETSADGLSFSGVEWQSRLPDGCAVAEGLVYSVSGPHGEPYGACTISSAGFCSTGIWAPVDVELTVTVDPASIPDGYSIEGGFTQTFMIPQRLMNTDVPALTLIAMPVDRLESTPPAPGDEAEEAGLVIEPGQNWIAFVGEDGNIWLMKQDGGRLRQITDDAAVNGSYAGPAWSHDGAMLAFSGALLGGQPGGLWLLRDGAISRVAGTDGCSSPAFTADNQRLLFSCPIVVAQGGPVPADLATNPALALVSSVSLDGGDPRVEIAYTTDASGVPWTNDGKAFKSASGIDVRPSDGMLLVSYAGFRKAGAFIFAPDGALIREVTLYELTGEGMGPREARFAPNGQSIVVTTCSWGCYPLGSGLPTYEILKIDLNGAVLESWGTLPEGTSFSGIDSSPGGQRLIASYGVPGQSATVIVLTAPGEWSEIGAGSAPVWQPRPPDDAPDSATAAPTAAGNDVPIVPRDENEP